MRAFEEMKRRAANVAIIGFRGRYNWLANDYPAVVEWNGQKFSSVQAAMDAMETHRDAGAAAINACAELLKQKFGNKLLRGQLMATDTAVLVNKYEPGQDPSMPQCEKLMWGVVNGHGKNVLGQLLMAVRESIRKELSMVLVKETLPPFGGGK
jgi:hypothetical protein